jgi:hypothetical protein
MHCEIAPSPCTLSTNVPEETSPKKREPLGNLLPKNGRAVPLVGCNVQGETAALSLLTY